MPNGRRWNISYPRKFTAGGIIAVGIFVASAGVGLLRWSVVAVGIALNVLAVSLIVISAIRAGARSFIRGTAHVLDVTDPPANTPLGRCELQVVVGAEALAPVKVKIHDDRTPVAKWPEIGDTLPVRVAVEDPHHVRILWGEVSTHAERAAEEERFQMHVQRIVDAELATEGEPGHEAGSPAPADEPTAVPRPRPSPRPRRPAGDPAPAVVGAPAGGTPAVPEPEAVVESAAPPNRDSAAPPAAGDEDEVPVHDMVPIEGASAVLGRPGGGADGGAGGTSAAEAGADADTEQRRTAS